MGIPTWLLQRHGESNIALEEDIILLASSFEFAYTSPERLTHRSQSSVVISKEAEQTYKNNDYPHPLKLELKAFEVGNANTYRLMEEIQLVAATTFSAIADYDTSLTIIWRDTKARLRAVYEKYYLHPEMIVNKTAASKIIDSDVQRDLRQILTRSAHQVGALV